MAETREYLDRLLVALAELHVWGAETSEILERLRKAEIEAGDPESVASGLRLSLTAAETARSAREKLLTLRLVVRRLRKAMADGYPDVPEEQQRRSSTTQGECLEVYTDPFEDVLRSLLERLDDLGDALTEFVDHLRAEVLHRHSPDSARRRAAAIARGRELAGPVVAGVLALRTVATGLRGYIGR